MDPREGFAAEIRADPEDVSARLVYADYLEESGDPQGELIRIQCELAGTPVTGWPAARLQEREEQLLDQYGEMWLAPLRDLGAEGVDERCFRRGLIERVRIDAGRLAEVATELCEVAPALHCLEVRGIEQGINEFVAATLPPQIVELELASNRLNVNYVEEFLRADWRGGIRVLNLGFNRLGDAGVDALAQQDWPALRRLVLDSNRIGPAGVQSLAPWPSLMHVEVLTLNLNAIGAGVAALAGATVLGNLRRLELASNGVTAEGAAAIAGASWFKTIEEFVLRNNPVGTDGLRSLARSSGGGSLTKFDVRNTTAREYGAVDAVPPEFRERFGEAVIADRTATGAGS